MLLGRPDPRAIQSSVAEVLKLGTRDVPEIVLHTDDHPAYPRAFKVLPDLKIQHHVTSSLERRTTSNPLFPVNLLDLLLRHGGANHKRETIAFSKRRQGAIERASVLQVWRNFMRAIWVKRPRGPTPAMLAGVASHRVSVAELFGRRLFPTHGRLPALVERYYYRRVVTPAVGVNREHALKYAC